MNEEMRFGVVIGNKRPFDRLVQEAKLFESLGFDSVWVVDHFMEHDEDTPYFESWTLLSALAMATMRVRLGVMVSGNTYRNPGLLTKEVITVDHVTGGRVELGVGAGWFEREHEAYSFPFPSSGERVSMFAEALQIIDSLMTEHRTSFDGDYYRFVNAPCVPKPVQQPRIPFVIGAHQPRMMRLAAQYGDAWNTRGEPDDLHPAVSSMRRAIQDAGRSEGDVRFSVYTRRHPYSSPEALEETIDAYQNVGFREILFPISTEQDVHLLERCALEVFQSHSSDPS